MHIEFNHTNIFQIIVGALIIVSMLLLSDKELAGFPLYNLMFFLIVLCWMAMKITFRFKEGQRAWQIRHSSDLLVIAIVVFELFGIIIKLFQDSNLGDIGIVNHVVIISFAFLYVLLSEQYMFWNLWFDLLLYSGLLVIGMFLLPYFTDIQSIERIETVTASSGKMASYLMLVGMICVYQYCTCKDKMRSWFYLLIATIDFLALILNHNMISFWLMVLYFLAVPVMFRARASLIKKDMQLFGLFCFMLSNMCLLTNYSGIIRKEVSFSLEYSVYLDLLFAIGAVVFFHYWDRIPEGVDLEYLVMRKLRKAYQFLLKLVGIVFVGVLLCGNRWDNLTETPGSSVMQGFAGLTVKNLQQEESGFYCCFEKLGILGGVAAIFAAVWLFQRMWHNYHLDKPCTSLMILISTIFMVQLLFWNPSIQTYVVYFVLLVGAAFYKEKREHIISVKINAKSEMEE